MGGNAFKDTNIRLDKEQYLKLEQEVVNLCVDNSIEYRLTKYFKEKDSFGDLDIIIYIEKDRDLNNIVRDRFNVANYLCNGSVESFALLIDEDKQSTFQVDFIVTPKENLDSAEFYFSYNDLNNLAGKLARHLSCSFGFEGLFYSHYSDNKETRQRFLLTTNPIEIYNFLDLDINKFNQGFNNLEEIYKFIESSRLFHPGIFLLENLNHTHRTRDRKRVVYSKFLDYIKENYSNIEKPTKPNNTLNIANTAFPASNLENKVKLYTEQLILGKEAASVCKSIVKQVSYGGEELGEFISFVKEQAYKMYLIDLEDISKFTQECKEYFDNK
jgi:hypothetical protein